MSAVLFGSISTVADTSELQRQAFNDAFVAHGLDWRWDREDYVATLDKSGGRNRIAAYADSVGQQVDAKAVHDTKSQLFQKSLATAHIAPRPGVVETIEDAKSKGLKVALVTTTSPDNIAALADALSATLPFTDFDLVVDSSSVSDPKPDKAAYAFALDQLAEQADNCVAIEDNVKGVESAVAAGVACVAFPNENTGSQDFAAASRRVDHLDMAELQQLTGAARNA